MGENIVAAEQPAEQPAETRELTDEERQKAIQENLATPIPENEVAAARTDALVSDVCIAQLELANAQLRASLAANDAEIARHRLAKAIILRRLANNG